MRTGGVLNILGKLLILLSLFLLTPIPFSLHFGDGMTTLFMFSALLGFLAGGSLIIAFLPDKELGNRDGFAVVVLSWVSLAFLGALPYYFSGQMNSIVDCYFESMSGFTTTGSTILTQVEILPKSLLFWRAMTQWLGGMGIIVLSLAILPLLGVGGMQLFQAEMPGPTKDRLAPRMQNTARILWAVYVLFTLVETFLLMLGGLDLYDALCHSFATLATGGFSTHSASVGHFNSTYIEIVVILFMFIAGTNFSLHYQGVLNKRPSAYWRNEEFCYYFKLLCFAVGVIVTANLFHHTYESLGQTLRTAFFQVISILTTTGFGTADFDQWPPVCKVLLVSLMFVGGCAGSTGGGIKIFRIMLFLKYSRLQLRRLVHPTAVGTIKIDNVKVPSEIKTGILGFFSLYITTIVVAGLIVAATGVDIVTGTTSVIATLNNIGPGLHLVGPAQNFGHMPELAKCVLIFCMLAGRLELYTVAVLMTPDFWKMARKPIFRGSSQAVKPLNS